MKAVILAGGLGTRLSEETTVKPKPMVEVGGMPILWHIMKIYSHFASMTLLFVVDTKVMSSRSTLQIMRCTTATSLLICKTMP